MSRLLLISLLIVAVTAQQAAPAAPAPAPAATQQQQAPATVDLSSVHQKLDTLSASVQSLSDLKSSLASLSSAQTSLQSSLQTLTQESNALKQAVEQHKSQPVATPAASVDVSGLTNKFTESQSSLASISSSIEKTLAQLTAAQEASEKSKASVAELSSKAEAKWNTITNELRDIKNLLQTISTASAAKKDDNKASDAHHSLLSKIEETQKAILHKLEHSSLSHQFWNGYEQLRVYAVHYGREFWALTERGIARAQEYAPIVTEKAQSIYETLSTDGLKHATTAYGHGEQFVLDSHGRLTSILSQQGVPHEHAPLASISILSLLGLIVVILYVKLLFAFLRCITCRSGKKVAKKGTPAAVPTPAKKK